MTNRLRKTFPWTAAVSDVASSMARGMCSGTVLWWRGVARSRRRLLSDRGRRACRAIVFLMVVLVLSRVGLFIPLPGVDLPGQLHSTR